MKFTDIFIARPVLAISISLMLTILGLQALSSLSVRQYPEITNTVITVNTGYYGAGSDLIQGFITQPLQQAIAQADNIDYLTSKSKMGVSIITANMKLNTDPNAALADILSRVNSVKSQLPAEALDPTITLSTGSTTAILYISFSSDKLVDSQITDYLQRVVNPQLFTVPGISKIDLYGGADYAMRIWLKPTMLASHNITASEVVSVLKANNYQSSSGQIIGQYTLLNTNSITQVSEVQDLRNLVVSTASDGTIVRLKDVADVTLEKNHDTYRALANSKKAVLLGINGTPTANPLDIAADVREMLPTIEKNLPPAIKMELVYDSTESISESINEVIHTIVEAAVIVLVVITLFMGSFRAVIIPIITIPLSMIGVMLIMSTLGFSINLMTLLALVLAIGLVVDDAIVVVENVDRLIKEGNNPFVAAVKGTREIALPVISMTITLAAVYSPIAFMGGLTGSLFCEFALTLAGSVIISGIIALTLSPMMCSKMLRAEDKPSLLEEYVNKVFSYVISKYDAILSILLQNRMPVVISAGVIFVCMPFMFKYAQSELAPYEDNGTLMMYTNAPNSSNLDFIQDGAQKLSNIALNDPAVKSTISFIGIPESNQGMAIFVLKGYDEREDDDVVMERLKPLVTTNPNQSAVTFKMPPLPGASSGLPIQLVIMTPNSFEQLNDVTQTVMEKINKSGLFIYADADLKYDSGSLEIEVDRDRAGAFGVTMSEIGNTLSVMVSDAYVNRVAIDGRAYEVIPQVKREDRLNPKNLNKYYVKSQFGKLIPLGSLISTKVKTEPSMLNQMSQQNAVTISLQVMPGKSMGDAINFFNSDIIPSLPLGYTVDYKGESRQFVTEGSALVKTFMLAICIIFLVLAIQFESWRDPFVIMIAVPLAISGALIVLALGVCTMNIYTQVGLITLVGLIAKHGILICEVSRENQLKHAMNKIEAVKQAASVRLRPILMTTAAMVAGLLPLLVASGAGAESRKAIGIVIVMGLSVGTLFTLFVLPVVYSYIGQEHKPLPKTDEIV